MVRHITLSRGLTALVDDADFERAAAFSWNARPSLSRGGQHRGWYAARSQSRDNRNTTIYLHRFLMDAPAGLTVDHIDGDGLNNLRENLRLCTLAQNNVNRPTTAGSGYRGVQQRGSKWRVMLEKNGRLYRFSGFLTAEAAARAYDAKAAELFGDFAVLNFPRQRSSSRAALAKAGVTS